MSSQPPGDPFRPWSLPAPGYTPEEQASPGQGAPPPPYPPSPYLGYPPPPPLIDPDRPFPGFGVAILLCLAFLLCTQVPAALIGGVLLVFFMIRNPGQFEGVTDAVTILRSSEASWALGTAMLVAQINVILFSLLMLRWLFGKDWARRVALRWPGLGVCLLVLASMPGFLFLGNLVYTGLKTLLPSAQNANIPGVEIMTQLFRSWPAWFGIAVIGFGPGIGEELWCRAFLGRGLVGRYGVWVGVAMTSFLFGAIHIEPCQGIMAMLMGLWLHYVYLTTRSLLMPMLLHTLNNSVAVLETHFSALQDLERTTSATHASVELRWLFPLIASVVLFAVVGWALYQTRARLVSARSPADWEPPFVSADCPPADSAVRVEQGRLSAAGVCLVLLAFASCAGSLVWLMRSV